MKTRKIKKYLKKRLVGGSCKLCGKFVLLGLRRKKELLCFNCIRLIMMYLGKQFDISFLMTKKPLFQHRQMVSSIRVKHKKKKHKRINPFTEEEINEMRGGAAKPKPKPKPKKVKPGTSGFEWT